MADTARVLEALDTTVAKLKEWAPQVLKQMGGTTEEVERLIQGMNHDTLLYVPKIRELLKTYEQPLAKKDFAFFRTTIFPPEFFRFQPTPEIVAKGFLFVEIFQSLLKDLDSV